MAGPTIGSTALILTADDQKLQKGLTEAGKAVKRFRGQVESDSKGIGSAVESGILGAFGKIAAIGAGVGGAAFAGFSLGSLVSDSVKLAAEVEDTQTTFRVLIGDAGKAAKLFEQIRDMGAETPLTARDLAGAAQSLLGVGVATEQIIPTLRMLGDLAGGDSQKLKDLAGIYGKAMGKGALDAEILNQLIDHQVILTKELAKALGVTEAQLRPMLEEGKVGFGDLQRAMIAATSDGGRFINLMEEKSKTLSGKLSTLKDNWEQLLAGFGKLVIEEFGLKDLIDSLATAADKGKGGLEQWRPLIHEIAVESKAAAKDIFNVAANLAILAAKAADFVGTVDTRWSNFKARLAQINPVGGSLLIAATSGGVAGGGGANEQAVRNLIAQAEKIFGAGPESAVSAGILGAAVRAAKAFSKEVQAGVDVAADRLTAKDFDEMKRIKDEFDPLGAIARRINALNEIAGKGGFANDQGAFQFARAKLEQERKELLNPKFEIKPAGLAVADSREAAEAIIAQTIAQMGGGPQDKVLNKLEQERKAIEDMHRTLQDFKRLVEANGGKIGVF